MNEDLTNVDDHRELDDTENVGFDLEEHDSVRLALGMVQDYVRHLANDTDNPGIAQETAQAIIGEAQDIKDDGVDYNKIAKRWLLDVLKKYRSNLDSTSASGIVALLGHLVKVTEKHIPGIADNLSKDYRQFKVINHPNEEEVGRLISTMALSVKGNDMFM